ncbi:MAG: ABC transporter permease [FCB group bacterium]|jgi:ribose/xylose/arabinose/galactoside ABC-type transport system permease subunit|nr:ABC transporter permease [FCB group bacterium]
MPSRSAALSLLESAGVYAVAALLVVVGMFISSDFLTADNFLNILSAVALLGIASAGMAYVTYSGNMADLSLPAIMAFSGIIAVAALPFGLPVALAAGMLAGLAIGAMNGLVVGMLNANPILWTLAVAFFMEGFMRFTWSNNQIYPATEPGSAGEAFTGIFRLHVGPVPLIVCVMLLLFVLGHLVMARTRFGLESKLVGSSRAAARTAGIRVSRVVFWDFMAAAFCASIAGIFLTSMTRLGVFYLGQGYDFRAVTAVVIGGVMLSGGRGHMPGVFGGVLVIGLMTNIMTFLGITSFRQNIITGMVFIAVVGVQQYRLRAKGKDYA